MLFPPPKARRFLTCRDPKRSRGREPALQSVNRFHRSAMTHNQAARSNRVRIAAVSMSRHSQIFQLAFAPCPRMLHQASRTLEAIGRSVQVRSGCIGSANYPPVIRAGSCRRCTSCSDRQRFQSPPPCNDAAHLFFHVHPHAAGRSVKEQAIAQQKTLLNIFRKELRAS
jgi:predicted Zn-dependent protease